MNDLVRTALDTVEQMYDVESARFSATSWIDVGTLRSRFDHPVARRYTINTLLGLQRAEGLGYGNLHVPERTASFIDRDPDAYANWGDRGLLLELLATGSDESAQYHVQEFCRVRPWNGGSLSLQELAWVITGLLTAAEARIEGAQEAAAEAYRVLRERYVDSNSAFPIHSLSPLRKGVVSFGGITYYLRALNAVATSFDDDEARAAFIELTRKLISLQGPLGEWAWFYDTRRGAVAEWYEIYGVHQHSMAHLFLLPALDLGVEGTHQAIDSSLRWVTGVNEVGRRMCSEQPFLPYRSIRRSIPLLERGPLPTGVARHTERGVTFMHSMKGLAGAPAGPRARRVEINTECRSYELGWFVFVWPGEKRFSWFTSGDWLKEVDPPSA